MKLGLIRPEDTITDPGYFDIPGCGGACCRKFNSGQAAHGVVNLQRALTVSSDVYFYKLGFDLWAARDSLHDDTALQNAASDLGFGQTTGIELPGESRGRLPTPTWLREYDRKLNGRATDAGRWTAGVNMNVAIGQGDVLVTPLQVANAYAGVRQRRDAVPADVSCSRSPRRGSRRRSSQAFRPRVIRTLAVPARRSRGDAGGLRRCHHRAGRHRDVGVRRIQSRCSRSPARPARLRSASIRRRQAAATGHLVVRRVRAGASRPQYLGATVIEAGGFGSDAAAPVVRNILEPISTGRVPDVPKGGLFNANDIFNLQRNPVGYGPND